MAAPSSPAAAKQKKQRRSTEYSYTELASLQQADANFYGVVDRFDAQPKRTAGADMVMNVVLIDRSLNTDGLHVNIFAKDEHAFPRIKAKGDVLRCHRIEMQIYNGRLQGVARGRKSAFLCITGDREEDIHSTGKSYTFTDEDRKRVQELRAFAGHALSTAPSLQQLQLKTLTIAEIRGGGFFDLCCRVVGVRECATEQSSHSLALLVCDGTSTTRSGGAGGGGTGSAGHGTVQPIMFEGAWPRQLRWLISANGECLHLYLGLMQQHHRC